jgi:hypothetical protein
MTIVATELLTDLRTEVRALEADLRARVEEFPALDEPFRVEWEAARAAGRTASSFPAWRDGQLTQVAVAWLLACTFVRFCEDNDLVAVPRLGGPGPRRALAGDYRAAFYGSHPGAGARESSATRRPCRGWRRCWGRTTRCGAWVPRPTGRSG